LDICETIKVNPWGKDQGEFVEINSGDFDPAIHTMFDSVGQSAADAPELSGSSRKGKRRA
jgi:hypothetical protein